MSKLILSAVAIITFTASAQNNTASNIIEGDKTLVKLVSVFKMPKYVMSQQPIVEKKDSCTVKNTTDFSVKNSTAKSLPVSLHRRNGNI